LQNFHARKSVDRKICSRLVELVSDVVPNGVRYGLPCSHGEVWIDGATIHALTDQEVKPFIINWLQLCHTDKMKNLYKVDQDTRDEALRRRHPPSQ